MVFTKGNFFIYSVFGSFIIFRFITDLSCFIFELIFGNSNPVFHFTLPINAILIFHLFNNEFNFKNLLIPFYTIITILFIDDLYFNSLFESSSTINIGTYFLISSMGFFGTLLKGLTNNSKTIIFPITAYYSMLFFYAIFEPFVDKSIFIYNSLFYLIALITLSLNLIFSRTIWLKKII